MIELLEIPDPAVLLAWEPEELGAIMLFHLRKRGEGRFNPGNLRTEMWQSCPNQAPANFLEKKPEIDIALSEAWAWLNAQGLIVPDPTQSVDTWRLLSRRARKIETKADLVSFTVGRLLPKEVLHPKIADRV